jgi:hypothetical protein
MDPKMIEDLKAFLKTAGFDQITRIDGEKSVTVTAVRGEVRAFFHATTEPIEKDQQVSGGGLNPVRPQAVPAVVPGYPELRG